jgi:glycosyltransferase involved in cell wall biosynthesis
MKGRGAEFLEFSFEKLRIQTFQDFEVIVSDHSSDTSIKNLCNDWSKLLDVKYFANPNKKGNSSANLNNAIRNAKGEYIKILFQDDFLYHRDSLSVIDANLGDNTFWLVTACEHTHDGIHFIRKHYPRYNHKIHLGINTISSPSVLTVRNQQPLLFDENLIWLMDVDYYKRLYMTYGEPKIVNDINVVNRLHENQVSQTIADKALQDKEYQYVVRKYEPHPNPVIICGAHGSNTSLITKMLRHCGFFVGSDASDLTSRKHHESQSFSILLNNFNQRIGLDINCGIDSAVQTPIEAHVHYKEVCNNAAIFDSIYAKGEIERVLDVFWRGNEDKRNRVVWGWKNPRNSFYVRIWESFFEDPMYLITTKKHSLGLPTTTSSGNWFVESTREMREVYTKPFGLELESEMVLSIDSNLVLDDYVEFNKVLSWLDLDTLDESGFAQLLETCEYNPKFQKEDT